MKRFVAKYLYTIENEGAAPIENGFVELDEDLRVIRTGKCEAPEAEGGNYYDGAIIPGMVNTHCHVELSYMKGLFRKGTGMAGFIDQINALRDIDPLEKRIEDIRYWMDRMYRRGVVAMGDISNCSDSFAIKASSPMYTRTFLEVFGTEKKDSPAVMEAVLKLQDEGRSMGLDCAPTPHSCYTMSPELVTESSREGLKSGYLSFHSEETPQEEDMIRYGRGEMWDNRKRAGMSTPPVLGCSSLEYFIGRLERIHPAPFTQNILLVHEVCMEREGMKMVREKLPDAYISLCPLSNLYIHCALPPVEVMREEGMNLTIGTDSLSSNDDLDMIQEVRCLQDNFPGVPLSEILSWATIGGARFLGKDGQLGSFEVGKAPGVVFVDNLSPEGRITPLSTSRRIDI